MTLRSGGNIKTIKVKKKEMKTAELKNKWKKEGNML